MSNTEISWLMSVVKLQIFFPFWPLFWYSRKLYGKVRLNDVIFSIFFVWFSCKSSSSSSLRVFEILVTKGCTICVALIFIDFLQFSSSLSSSWLWLLLIEGQPLMRTLANLHMPRRTGSLTSTSQQTSKKIFMTTKHECDSFFYKKMI